MTFIRLRNIIAVLYLVICFSCPLRVAAEYREKPEWLNRLSISIGAEALNYKEREPDTFTDSRATVINPTVHVNWYSQYGLIVGGLKGALPVAPTEDIEKWNSYGKKPYQTNVFKYEWIRGDAYLGYLMAQEKPHVSSVLYLGLRSSFQKQERDDFIVQGIRLVGKSVERTESYGILIGLTGKDLSLTKSSPSPWSWNYTLEFVAPVSAKTTNSSYPGVKFNDKRGYTYEIKLGIENKLSPSWFWEGTFYGGRMHWVGSNWKITPYGRLKWPRNDTDFLGINLSLTAKF